MMNSLFQIFPRVASISLIVALFASSAQATEFSNSDLTKAQNGLQGFEVSGRGIQPPPPFVYEGEFPRSEFEVELARTKVILSASGIRLPIHLANALKREALSDAELVVAVRSARTISARVSTRKETISEPQR